MIAFTTSLLTVLIFLYQDAKVLSTPQTLYSDAFVYGIAGLASGIYLSCFYSVISRGQSIHFQGILTGWIDSLRVFGEATATIVLVGLASFSKEVPIIISSAFFLLVIIIVPKVRSSMFSK